MKQAQEIDPLSLIMVAAAARPYYNARRYDEAIAQSQKALEIDSTFGRAHYWLGLSYEHHSRTADAVREFENLSTRVHAAASGGFGPRLRGERSAGERRTCVAGITRAVGIQLRVAVRHRDTLRRAGQSTTNPGLARKGLHRASALLGVSRGGSALRRLPRRAPLPRPGAEDRATDRFLEATVVVRGRVLAAR